ncbi:NAD(P)-dependent dehydrogenase, short-chain alcohol dehydrogenase family [Rhizobium sp. NFR07]|jgi:NAD(P)-dependent dehydrogenase (short-subunit alcohol dehydrogenase family)|uniref:SDR family oxidoreductase n=1 Tax=Rhizobium sp. NFR07 TaxID=1566262 RepID=UPI0008F0A4E9|nr:SDR family oxidoreductase [Rhizobium sp. NFR07]SFB55331.1 NAD(P)-dependent dehydrogenase, short-chain alcohol dehydrogenase family [Rhizobium sp. NFR07]
MQFSGKSVIITGAGKGIGRACAKSMAAKGAEVIALSRTAADLESLREEIGGRSVAVDLSDPAATRRAMAEAGTADFLINSAGTNVLESSFDMTEAGYEAVMGINLRAALITCQEFGRARVAAGGGGAIVNITSIAGHRGFTEHLCYAASKAGLEGATRVLAKEFGPHGIRVNAVAPTITLTELALVAWSDPAKSEPMMVRHPIGRFAEVGDVALAIIALLSSDMAMVNGAVLAVDGGFLAV